MAGRCTGGGREGGGWRWGDRDADCCLAGCKQTEHSPEGNTSSPLPPSHLPISLPDLHVPETPMSPTSPISKHNWGVT